MPQAPASTGDVDEDKISPPPAQVGVGTYCIDWASLLRRVFAVDILACGRCGGRMRVLAVVDNPPAVTKILEHLGLPAVPLDTAPARGPPQPSFAFDPA